MLKIEPNLLASKNLSTSRNQKKSHTQSFTAREIPCLSKAEEVLIENTLIKKHLGFFGRALDKLSSTAGEIQNILFIGFGTAFVAPIFIAYNSLAKEDERTKKYSAMRQPISAVIATATGFGINYPIAKWFSKASAEGKLGRFDMSAKPSTDIIKESYNHISKKLSKYGADGINKLNAFDKKMYDYISNDKNNTLEGFKAEFDNFQSFEKKVVDVASKNAAEWLLSPNNTDNLSKMTLNQYLIKYLGFEQDVVHPSKLNPDSSKTKLGDMSALSFLKKFGMDDFDESKLRALLAKSIYSENFEKAANEDKKVAKTIIGFINKIAKDHNMPLSDSDAVTASFLEKYAKRGFSDAENKKIARIVEMFLPKDMIELEKIPAKTMFKAFGIEKDILEKPEWGSKSVSNFLLEMREFLKIDADKCKQSFDVEEFLKKVASKIAKERATSNAKALKAYSSVQGIVLSLIVLPFSCGLLNWSYPRIMEKFFPSLAGNTAAPKQENQKGENK